MHSMITEIGLLWFFVVLAMVPVQVISFLRKFMKKERFEESILTALAIERLKGGTSSKEGASTTVPEPREYYPVVPEHWGAQLPSVAQKSQTGKFFLVFLLGAVSAVAILYVIATF